MPDFAAVNEAVRIAKERSGVKASGFVNALLRRLASCKASLKPPQIALKATKPEFVRSVALAFSFPEQLVSRWSSRLRRKELVRLVSTLNQAPKKTIRVNVTKMTPSGLSARLKERGFDARESLVCPHALRLSGKGSLEETPEWHEGLFTIQDEGAQMLSLVLEGLKPQSIADVCAGIGQKLTHLAELFSGASLFGSDIYLRKIKAGRRQVERLGLKNVRYIASDLLSSPLRERSFDLVLLDAPCSGSGTIRRHPEIRWRVKPANLAKLARLQLKMLHLCAAVVRPDGVILYSTCSLEPEENEQVIKKFLRRNGEFRVRPIRDLPETLRASAGGLGMTLQPYTSDCDGMFYSVLART